jgi:hypothetical protein
MTIEIVLRIKGDVLDTYFNSSNDVTLVENSLALRELDNIRMELLCEDFDCHLKVVKC